MSLARTYTFKHSKQTWTGVPVMAANMDTVGTWAMALELAKHKVFTCMHKHYTVEDVSLLQPSQPRPRLPLSHSHQPQLLFTVGEGCQ